MGSSVHYLAIPTQSNLYVCLHKDFAFRAILFSLLPYSSDLYQFFDVDSRVDVEEVKETIEDILERYHSLLGSTPKLKVDSFFEELASVRARFPDIEQRTAMLEKCDDRIESHLVRVLAEDYINTSKLVRRLMLGDEILFVLPSKEKQSQDFFGDVIGIILPSTVQAGAAILTQIKPQDLFLQDEDLDDWDRENYRRWRRTYLAASEKGEALLVGRS